MDKQDLLAIFPYAKATPVGLDELVQALNHNFQKIGDTPLRNATFLAQTGYETLSFTRFCENLNYSAAALMSVFGRAFSSYAEAEIYAHEPEKIGNRVYANRMGNGDEKSGDGYRYRGRGAIECTGKYNYDICGQFLSVDLIVSPQQLEVMPYTLDCAYWFWMKHNLNEFADVENMEMITRRINGGLTGLAYRVSYYNKAKHVFGIKDSSPDSQH